MRIVLKVRKETGMVARTMKNWQATPVWFYSVDVHAKQPLTISARDSYAALHTSYTIKLIRRKMSGV